MIEDKNLINIQTTRKMYPSLSERSCENTTEEMIHLGWLNPKSDYFTEENIRPFV